MILRRHGSAIELSEPRAAASLPAAPPSVGLLAAFAGRARRERGRRRVAGMSLAAAVGVAIGLGLGLGALATPAALPTEAREGHPLVPASGGSGAVSGADGLERAHRVIAAVLAAAPRCTPEIRIAGAPVAEQQEFLDQARRLATEASDAQDLRSVRWRVVERGGRLFGVIYGERCE